MSISLDHLARPAATAAAVAALGLAAVATPAVASTAKAGAAKPTIVFVHGAFADSSGWAATAKRLSRDGYRVRSAPNPLRGITSDATTVRAVLDSIKGPKIVVGHSYGGAVITKAAAGAPGVKALAYVAAFAPDTGEAVGALTARPVARPIPPLPLIPVPVQQANGATVPDLYLNPKQFRARFAADVPAGVASQLAFAQRPISAAAFAEPLTGAPAWKTVPSWYLIPSKDRAIAPDLERFMAKRAHAHTTTVRGASHAVFVSHPKAVERLVLRADRATR